MRPLKLLFLAEARSVHSWRWIKFFASRGHEIDWISLSPAEPDADAAGLRFHPVAGGMLPVRIIRAVALARRILRTQDIEVLHSHYAGTYGLAGALCGFHPFVLTAWGSDVLMAGRAAIRGPLVRFALKRADLITCDAEHMREALTRLGVRDERIQIIYFGTDTDQYHPSRRTPDLRRRLGVGAAPLVISIRTLHPIYDVESLIRAVPAVLREVSDARFLIGGDGPERVRLEELARQLGVSSAIHFLGMVGPSDLPEYLASADVYVSTSTSDGGLAASTAEAMACATPVVITDFGQNREWVTDGVSGRIIPLRDPASLASAVSALLRDAGMRRAMGGAGREVIVTRNNYAREMGRMEALYAQLAARCD